MAPANLADDHTASPLLQPPQSIEQRLEATESDYSVLSNSQFPIVIVERQHHVPPESDPPTLHTSQREPPLWPPLSLQRPYLLALAALSLVLAICCFTLVAISRSRNGISEAESGGSFNFRKRFLSTFIAVLYTLIWTPVYANVIRTEPWAFVSRSVGACLANR